MVVCVRGEETASADRVAVFVTVAAAGACCLRGVGAGLAAGFAGSAGAGAGTLVAAGGSTGARRARPLRRRSRLVEDDEEAGEDERSIARAW